MNILVVEDELMVAMMIEMALTEAGHVVIGPAARASEAVKLAEEHRPDLALLDINLADGPRGCALAKYLMLRWNIHAIFVTASTQDALAHQDVALGLIEKPFSERLVVESVLAAGAILEGDAARQPPPDFRIFH